MSTFAALIATNVANVTILSLFYVPQTPGEPPAILAHAKWLAKSNSLHAPNAGVESIAGTVSYDMVKSIPLRKPISELFSAHRYSFLYRYF